MANKPGEANFFPNVPVYPEMGTFQPVYGKFDLTTYIQGASDYEIMAFLVGKYNACLEAYDKATKLSTDTITAAHQLQEWINNWFDNLDVQEELNKKIDNMVHDGSFGRLLHQTFDTQINQQTTSAVTAWLVANVTPTGSAVVVDKSLSIEGAAADAKTTGKLKEDLSQFSLAIDKLNKELNIIPLSEYNQGSFDGGGSDVESSFTVRLNLDNVLNRKIYVNIKDGYEVYFYNVKSGVFNDTPIKYYENTLHFCKAESLKIKIFHSVNGKDVEITPINAFSNVSFFIVDNDTILPKTIPLSYTLKIGGMYPDGNYTSVMSSGSSVQVYLANKLEVGEKYRIKIANGYNIFLSHGGQRRCIYDTQMFDFVADSDYFNLCLIRRDGVEKSDISDFSDLSLELSHVVYKNPIGYDYVVASSNSDEYMKKIADLVCDGVNDEVFINCAVNGNVTHSSTCKVMLANGTYNIGKFHNIRPSYSSNYYDADSKLWGAICVMDKFGANNTYDDYDVKISGQSETQPLYDTEVDIETVGGAIISVKQSIVESMNDADEYFVIGVMRDTTKTQYLGGYGMNKFLMLNNLSIDVYNSSKKIIGIDGVGSQGLACENISVCATRGAVYNGTLLLLDSTPFADGACGIRGDKGNDNGTGKTYFKSCFTAGFTEGIALNGEHIVLENCLEKFCKIGLTIGNYDVSRELQHPIVCIGNSIEQCERMMLLNRFGATEETETNKPVQTIVYIGGSTETSAHFSTGTVPMKPIKEVVKGAYRGRIETDYRGANISVFEKDNSGKNISAIVY